jgi:hypothetical protein
MDSLADKHKKYLLSQAKYTLFERVAGELAGTFYESCRSEGMPSEFKSAKAFARAKFLTFLPKAIELCLDMLHRPDIHQEMKDTILQAYLERANEPYLDAIDPHRMNMKAIEKMLPKGNKNDLPVIFNSTKITSH